MASAMLTFAPVLGLAAYCLSHVLLGRLKLKRGYYYPLFLGCGVGAMVTLIATIAALLITKAGTLDFAALAGMNLLEYLAFSFGYFNFINLNIASLRIRMLQELAERGGAMPAAELAACYNTGEVVALRIDRLVRGGHLVVKQGRFYSGKKKFLLVGRIFDFLRWFILGSKLPPAAPGKALRKHAVNRGTS